MNKLVKKIAVSLVSVLTLSFQTQAQTIADGLKNLDAERYNAAGSIFSQLVASAPTAENYFYQGYYFLNLPEPQLDKAKEAFQKGAALDAKRPDPLARVGLATVKLLSGDKAGAKADFDLIKKDTKNKNPDVLYRIGEAYAISEKINDPAEAVTNIQAGLDIQKVKNNPNYYLALANAFILKNDGGPAMTALENAVNMGQNVAKIRTIMGRVWLQGKNYEKAKKELDDAIKADPEHAPAYYYLSSLWQTYQKYDLAAKNAKLYLEKSEATTEAKLRYVKLAFTVKDYDGAGTVLNEIFDQVKDPIKYRLKGYILTEKATDCNVAVDLIQRWMKEAGKDNEGKDRVLPLDYGYLGKAYNCIKEDKKLNDSLAIVYYYKAIELGDTTENYLEKIAGIYKTSKNWVKAAEAYKKIIDLSKKPKGNDYFNWASALYNSKDWKQADTAYAMVIQSYKDTWHVPYLTRARVKQYANPNDTTYTLASPFYEKYLTLLKEEDRVKDTNKRGVSEAYGYLGMKALLVEKNTQKATEMMNNALKYDPSNQNAQKVLQSISGGTPPPTTPPTGTPPNNGGGGSGGGTSPTPKN